MTESVADQPWLSLLTFLPMLGVLSIALRRWTARRDSTGAIEAAEQVRLDMDVKRVALIFTGGVFLVSVFLVRRLLR